MQIDPSCIKTDAQLLDEVEQHIGFVSGEQINYLSKLKAEADIVICETRPILLLAFLKVIIEPCAESSNPNGFVQLLP